MKKYF